LRAHRKYLPPAARVIGDDYVKAEFRRTKDIDNPVHIIGFLTQWQVFPFLNQLK
jgi:Complex1_LYR-like